MIRIALLTLTGISFCLLALTGENSIQKRVNDALENYYQKVPQEKVYLHLDKPYYHPRDTIWFKGYVADAMNLQPDLASRVLYVDLVDRKAGKLLASQTLRLLRGFASGYMDLPDSLSDGQYEIRSYTKWMRNFPEYLYFSKEIRVFTDIDRSYDEDKISKLVSIDDVQFFPEGGNLVNGILTRVAFKAVNRFGQGIDNRGYILNSRNDTVVAFQSSHLGMGYFNFKPLPGETYMAFIKELKGKARPFAMPPVLEEGFVLNIDNITRQDEIRLTLSHNYAEKKNVTLIAHQRGRVRYAAEIPEASATSVIKISRQYFTKDGIVHLTLFNQEGLPLCERLIYNNTDKPLKIEIKTNKTSYGPREKVEMDIEVKDISGKPVVGNFSLAVTDENQIVQEPFGENISSSFLLSSDVAQKIGSGKDSEIRGIIEQPGWYFDSSNAAAKIDLDILLMTQGWRRFLWNEILSKTSYDTTYNIELGLPLRGHISLKNGDPLKGPTTVTFIFTTPDGKSEFVPIIPDEDGNFAFNDLDFTGQTIITASQMNSDKKLKFTFDPPSEIQGVTKRENQVEISWISNDILKNFLLRERQTAEAEFLQSQMLNEVVVHADRALNIDTRKNLNPGVAQKDRVKVDLSLCAGAVNAFQILQNKIAGVKIYRDDNGGYRALLRSSNTFVAAGDPDPLYLVDGIPVDGSYINYITPCDIESIEVYKGPTAQWGTRGSNGVIAFYMRKYNPGDPGAGDARSKYTKIVRKGYLAPQQFYAPNYELNPTSTVADHRSTVYWQSTIVTGADGKAFVEFFNSDETNTRMRVVLEGMSYTGKVASASASYKVN